MASCRFLLSLLLLHCHLFQSDAVSATSLDLNSDNSWIGSSTVQGEGVVSGIPSSPDCWLHAIRAMEIDSTSTADACNWMTTKYQKIMALEMAKCHVTDLGRTLFDETSSRYDNEICSQESYQDNLASCLTHLTPSAETAYTHFLTYINQLCTRLSREMVMDRFYETSVNLAKASAEAERQLKEMIKHQEEMRESWNEREKDTALFHERFRHDVYQERIRWAKESAQLRSQWHQEQEEWLLQHQRLQQSQMNEINGQQRELRRQKNELAALSDTVARAHQSIRPWSLNLQSFYLYAQNAYRILKWMLHIIGSAILIWIFTMPQCLRWIRRYMLIWIVTGGLIEALFISLQQHGQSSDEDIDEMSSLLRGAMSVIETAFYLLGALISPCFRRGHQETNNTNDVDRWSLSSNDDTTGPTYQIIDSVPRPLSHQGQRFERIVTCPVSSVNQYPLQLAGTSTNNSGQYWATVQQCQSDRILVETPRHLPMESLERNDEYFDAVPFVSIEKSEHQQLICPSLAAAYEPIEALGLSTTISQAYYKTTSETNPNEKRNMSGCKRPFPASDNDNGSEDESSARSAKRPRLLDYCGENGTGMDDNTHPTEEAL
jgi:hypothetical protein